MLENIFLFFAIVVNWFLFLLYCMQLFLFRVEFKKTEKTNIVLKNTLLKNPSEQFEALHQPLTIIVPAYNEEKTITKSIESLLKQSYQNLTIYIINDGSADDTLITCLQRFNMAAIPDLTQNTMIPTKETYQFYQSVDYHNLYLIDKENGGKSDALNVGINYTNTSHVSFIDADTFLEEDALISLMSSFYFDPKIVSIGGLIRPMTNNRVLHDPKIRTLNLLKGFQYLEYLRSVLVFRSSLSSINSTVIISGAFGVYTTEIVRQIAGFETTSIGEDFDLTLKIRKYLNDNKIDKSQIFLSNSVCWTQPPARVTEFVKQRSRWQIGFLQTIIKQRKMVFRPRYRGVGMFSLPVFIFTELISLIIEVTGILIALDLLMFNLITWKKLLLIFLLSSSINLFFSLIVILQNSKLQKLAYRDTLYLTFLAYIEAFSFHWLSSYCKLKGAILFLKAPRKKHQWGDMQREEVR